MTKPQAGNLPSTGRQDNTPVVGIGASAGGIEALKEFFTAMPSDSGMAFVVVQHLEPQHQSQMAEILAKCTSMKVVQAEDGMPVEPNRVLTNAPGRAMSIRAGRIVLGMPPERRHVEAAIDHFLTSLADDKGESAACIILSGSSASDGPRGVRAVRGAGGLCMAQDPNIAQYPAMPQGAIDTGLVDYVLPASQMPAALAAYMRQVQVKTLSRDELPIEEASDDLQSILKLLRVRAKSDYQPYKKSTIIRRIRRRMALKQISSIDSYQKLLQTDTGELTQLSKDMLIGVSSFFRDSKAFEKLQSEAIVPLIKGKGEDSPLRAWVPACASGEEAYSVAMLMLESSEAAGKRCPIQVFASDVNEDALEAARIGIYPEAIAADIPAKRLDRFFTKQGQTYQVDKRLREAVVFSRQNLLIDPPFSKLNLISCRNVLIYLEPEAQKKVLSMFSFALNAGGYLLLGKSEGISGVEDLFEPVSKQKRIYRSTQSKRTAPAFPLYGGGRPLETGRRGERSQPASVSLAQANQTVLLKHFNASIVLVDPNGQIRHFYGQTEKYLGHPTGLASLNILDMTAGTLSAQLHHAMDKALRLDEPVAVPRAPLPRAPLPHDGAPMANLTVMRVPGDANAGKLLAIIFEDVQQIHRSASAAPVTTAEEPLVTQLETEVKALRSELRTNAEDFDTASEELKAANEEIMSMNEELQSANEELEASREELQSLNEELTTINGQLAEKVTDLTTANNDLANLLSATEIATVFLDSQLRIKRFTPRATELLNLIPADVGRPVSHISQNFPGEELVADAEKVLKTLSVVEKEVHARDGDWYTVRVLPYRTLDNRIDGVVITFSNVTRLKRAEGKLQYEKTYAESIVETVREPLIVLDGQLRIMSANTAFYRMFQIKPEDTVGQRIYDLADRQWDIERLRKLLEEIIPEKSAFQDFRVEHEFPQIGRATMLLSGRRIEPIGEMPERILMAMVDITEQERDREALRDRTALAERRADQLRELAFQLTQTEQRERKRLAHALHENLQQLLVGAKFLLEDARLRTQDGKTGKSIDKIKGLLDQSIEVSRAVSVEMSPPILFDAGLSAALPWLARQVESKKGLKVQTEINAKIAPDEEGMSGLLFSAVRELLFNVFKHAQVKSARVQLDRIDDDHIQIVVSDEGVGFDPTKLFASENWETGLGLFSIRERLEHVSGQLKIDTAPGRGTRVILVAPMRKEGKALEVAAAAHPTEAGVPRSGATSDAADRKIRVLLVDDHTIVRQGLMGLLKQEADIEVIAEAGDGQEAIELAHRSHPDVVVMDLSMPVMNGIEATRRIMAELPDTKVIGLSMYEETDQSEAMLEAGAKAYLSKGGPLLDLIAAIRAAAAAPNSQGNGR